jgi:hypothetical protein
VVTVCDNEYVRDVQALVYLARHLSTERYGKTDVHHVSLHNPDWAEVELDRADAVCFIGRPSMFQGCKLVDSFPDDLRFAIERGPSDRSSHFHHVRQNRTSAGPLPHVPEQNSSHRHDFAVVQRFPITFGGRIMTVLVIAGATSLGTVGAADWVTRKGMHGRERSKDARLAGLDAIDLSTRMEALLEVTGAVHAPAHPWKPACELRSLFFNHSQNVLKPPRRITMATRSGDFIDAEDVQYMLFDEDEIEFRGDDYAAVIAVCARQYLGGQGAISISDLVNDTRLWPAAGCPVKGDTVNFFRDHLQKRRLNKLVTVNAAPSTIHFRAGECQIQVVKAP